MKKEDFPITESGDHSKGEKGKSPKPQPRNWVSLPVDPSEESPMTRPDGGQKDAFLYKTNHNNNSPKSRIYGEKEREKRGNPPKDRTGEESETRFFLGTCLKGVLGF